MIVGRFIVRLKNAAIKNYNIQMELVKTFKKDWKEMQDASAPMPDPPDYEPPQMTIKKWGLILYRSELDRFQQFAEITNLHPNWRIVSSETDASLLFLHQLRNVLLIASTLYIIANASSVSNSIRFVVIHIVVVISNYARLTHGMVIDTWNTQQCEKVAVVHIVADFIRGNYIVQDDSL